MRRNKSEASKAEEDTGPTMWTKRLRGHLGLIVTTGLLTISVALALTVRAYNRRVPAPPEAVKRIATLHKSTEVPSVQSVPINTADLIRRGTLASQLHPAFQALGSRLERPGKERLAMTGTLEREGDVAAFALIWELPGKLRLTEQRGGRAPRVLVFDGEDVKSNDSRIDEKDRRTLELLLFDSVEHFFVAQASGRAATRILGSRFRRDGDLANTYDLVETTEDIGFKGAARQQTRIYYFNSDTHLLERVSYRDYSTGSESVVSLSDWRTAAGNQIAHRIELLQDDVPVLTLVIDAVSVGPRVADGAFTIPR